MQAGEGTMTYSDLNGELLFFSDGNDKNRMGINDSAFIYNKNSEPMPNGYLGTQSGDATVGQLGVIIPFSSDSNKFYFIMQDGFENHGPGYRGLTYCIIDMTLDNGLGDVSQPVTAINMPTIHLQEKKAVTKHSNGIDYWMVTREFSSPDTTSQFLIYQITDTAIYGPFIQFIGPDNDQQGQGSMKFNVQGDKIVCGESIFDFDNSTGVLSNPTVVGKTGYFSFSKSGKYLYVVHLPPGVLETQILQYDLDVGYIPASEQLIYVNGPNAHGDMQIGPDEKIYIVDYNTNSLSVINSPESSGLACNLVLSQVDLGIGTCFWELPDYVDCNLFEREEEPSQTYYTPKLRLEIFPNPASDIINLKYQNLEIIHVDVLDGSGKKVYFELHNNQIDIKHLSSGLYYIQVNTDQGNFIQKFVKR